MQRKSRITSVNLGEPLVADYGVRDGHQEREEMEIVHRCDLGRSPNPWHETIPDPCRIVAVARKLGEERAVFEGGAQDVECDGGRDGNQARPGTEEEGDGGEEPDHADIPRVSDVRIRAFGVDLVAAIELDSHDVGEERVRHHRKQCQRVCADAECGGDPLDDRWQRLGPAKACVESRDDERDEREDHDGEWHEQLVPVLRVAGHCRPLPEQGRVPKGKQDELCRHAADKEQRVEKAPSQSQRPAVRRPALR